MTCDDSHHVTAKAQMGENGKFGAGEAMSVIVLSKFRGDPGRLEAMMHDRRATFETLAAEARRHGAMHHRIAGRDGEVLVIGEWQCAEDHPFMCPHRLSELEILQDVGLEEHWRSITTSRVLILAEF
jgi:hypothetical protein